MFLLENYIFKEDVIFFSFHVLEFCYQKIEMASIIFLPIFSKDNMHDCLCLLSTKICSC